MTSNLLQLPFKQTKRLESFGDALIDFVAKTSATTHPDQIANDAKQLERMRAVAVPEGQDVTVDQTAARNLTAYYAQLSHVSTKLPNNVGITFEWYPLFSTPPSLLAVGAFATQTPIALENVQYERLSVLYNLAAFYAALALQYKRTDENGMKAAIAAFQNAAGVLSHLLTLLPLLKPEEGAQSSASNAPAALADPASPDLTLKTIEALRDVCLAQAQEVFWSKGVMDRLKNGTIAKLAARVSELYGSAVALATEARGAGGVWPAFAFPEALMSHLAIKQLHFAAVAQYRRSLDDLGSNRYGDELGRLEVAEGYLKRAQSLPKKGVSESVLKDLKSLATIVTDNKARATKDNNLIYLEAVTPLASLPPIVPAAMARPTPPAAIVSPLDHLHSSPPAGLGAPLFSSLVPYEVHRACELYDDRKAELVRTELTTRQDELDGVATRTLTSLGLPASVDAVAQPIGLPGSLVERVNEVKSEGGVAKLRDMLQDVRRVARVNLKLLNEAQTLLAQEKEEDDRLRAQHGTDRWTRPPSDVAGAQLKSQVDNFAGVVSSASASDGVVRTKFGTHEKLFELLSSDQSALERSIPKLENPSMQDPAVSTQAASLRQLRRLLDDLDDLRIQRRRIVDEAKRVAHGDDVRPQVEREAERRAAAGERLQLHMFEGIFEDALVKYARYGDAMRDNRSRQEDVLDQIKSANDAFLNARRTDPSLGARERALQEMDNGFALFKEVLSNLKEGLRFYGDLSKLLQDVRDACKHWTAARHDEAQEQVQALLSSGINGVRISNVKQPGDWRPEDGIRFG